VLVFSMLLIVQFLGVLFGGISLPRELCWFIPVVSGGSLLDAWHSPVCSAKCLQSNFWADIWQSSSLLFSQCNMVWRGFLWARVSRCWSFDFPSCFISAMCSSNVSARFLIHWVHVVCFCALVTILNPFTFRLFKTRDLHEQTKHIKVCFHKIYIY
jgi:hypothetical protein